MTSMDPVADRRRLEYECSAVRLLAIIDFSLILIVLAFVAFFFGFDAGIEQLFLLSTPHILLAPLAGYAALRLGLAVVAALGVLGVVFLLDVAQWFIRVFAFPLTLLSFVFLVVNTAFIVIDILYAFALWRLRVTDKAQNSDTMDSDRTERNRAVIRQEANTVRLTALFGLVTIIFVALVVLVFFSLVGRETFLFAFSVLHIIVAPYGLVLATRGKVWMLILLVAAVILLVLDGAQLVLRFLDIRQGQLVTLTLGSLFAVFFILINIGLLLIDLMYIIGSAGYIYEKIMHTEDAITTPTGAAYVFSDDNSSHVPFKVSRRRGKTRND